MFAPRPGARQSRVELAVRADVSLEQVADASPKGDRQYRTAAAAALGLDHSSECLLPSCIGGYAGRLAGQTPPLQIGEFPISRGGTWATLKGGAKLCLMMEGCPPFCRTFPDRLGRRESCDGGRAHDRGRSRDVTERSDVLRSLRVVGSTRRCVGTGSFPCRASIGRCGQPALGGPEPVILARRDGLYAEHRLTGG
jgi:hypothetical protein